MVAASLSPCQLCFLHRNPYSPLQVITGQTGHVFASPVRLYFVLFDAILRIAYPVDQVKPNTIY